MALGEKAKSEDDLMVIKPTLFGERHDPNLKGSVANLTSHNMGLGQVTRGICKGKYYSLKPRPPEGCNSGAYLGF